MSDKTQHPLITIEVETKDGVRININYPSYPVGVFSDHIESIIKIITEGLSR